MKQQTTRLTLSMALLVVFSASLESDLNGQIKQAERFVQISSINFGTSVIELTNFGTDPQPLDGWRFCSHDEDQVRVYSGSTGLNGITLAGGASLFIHLNNDASGTNEINASTVGAFAAPLDGLPAGSGAYAISIYYQTPFGNGDNIADHLQFSFDGLDNPNADERSDEAEAGGVWTDQSLWTVVDETSTLILLNRNNTQTELHGPDDYTVVAAGPNVFTAEGLTLFRGILAGGTIEDTRASDDVYLTANPGFTLNPTEPPVWIISETVLPTATATALSIRLEAGANSPNIEQTVEMFNWNTSMYDSLDSRSATFNSDFVLDIDITGMQADYVEAGTGNTRIRSGWQAMGFVLVYPWTVSIDEISWTAEY